MRSFGPLSALLALLALDSPARADTAPLVEPAGAPEAEALRGAVLVWQDAALFAEPSDTAASVRAGALDASRKERVGHVVPMRVLGARGAFVEVEPADEPDCTWS